MSNDERITVTSKLLQPDTMIVGSHQLLHEEGVDALVVMWGQYENGANTVMLGMDPDVAVQFAEAIIAVAKMCGAG